MKSARVFALCLTLIGLIAPPSSTPIQPAEFNAKRIAPIRRRPGFETLKKQAETERQAVESGQLAPEEAALQPTPRFPSIATGFAGMNFTDTPGFVPPDTHAATGPDHVVETVNTDVAIFNRNTGVKIFQQDLSVFFSSVGASTFLSDPVVAYDELAQRFFIGVIDFGSAAGTTTHLLYAVSDISDPTAGFTEMQSIDVTEAGNSGCLHDTVTADFTRVGWNADAHVFTFNMFNVAGTCFDHVTVIAIDKSTVLDKGVTPFKFFHTDRDHTNFTLVPAVMHGASPGDPMWFVEEAPFLDEIRTVKMTDILSNTPTFTEVDIAVVAYNAPPSATQKGGGTFIDTGDSRILNTEWRSNRLIASQTVGISGTAHARWYEFDTSGISPSLTQEGTISPASGIHTYYPSIAIAANGDLGMTFMESSNSEFMSMYLTGQSSGDPPGTMQTPALTKAGLRNYSAFDCPSTGDTCRAGDFSGITADPDLTNVFCAANEYATASTSDNWGTWIACFSLGVHDLAVTKMTAPATVTGTSPITGAVTVTIQNRSDHNETVSVANLGDGSSSGLVQLTVNVVDAGSESCRPAIVNLDGARNGKLFANGPKVLKPGATVTVSFLVTYECTGALPKNIGTSGDYSHTATVHHEALDGRADMHTVDDTCPRPVLPGGLDPNPPPKGTKDKGCRGKGAPGAPVLTNVVL